VALRLGVFVGQEAKVRAGDAAKCIRRARSDLEPLHQVAILCEPAHLLLHHALLALHGVRDVHAVRKRARRRTRRVRIGRREERAAIQRGRGHRHLRARVEEHGRIVRPVARAPAPPLRCGAEVGPLAWHDALRGRHRLALSLLVPRGVQLVDARHGAKLAPHIEEQRTRRVRIEAVGALARAERHIMLDHGRRRLRRKVKVGLLRIPKVHGRRIGRRAQRQVHRLLGPHGVWRRRASGPPTMAAEWHRLGETYYRRTRLYELPWPSERLEQALVAASSDGGLLAMARDPRQLVALGEAGAIEPQIHVYTGAGQLLETLPLDTSSQLVALGFSWRDDLVTVMDDGHVRVCSLLVPCPRGDAVRQPATPSSHYVPLSLGIEAADTGVAAALVCADRVWALLRSGAIVEAPLPTAPSTDSIWTQKTRAEPPRVHAPLAVPPSSRRLVAWAPARPAGLLLATEQCVWALDARGYRELPHTDGPYSAVRPSPNGQLLALLASHEVRVVRADGTQLRAWDVRQSEAYQRARPMPRVPELLDDTAMPSVAHERGGLGGTGLCAIEWCGDNVVALAWPGEVLLLGPYDEPVHLAVHGVPFLYGDAAGVRIVDAHAHDHVARVASSTAHALRAGSTHVAALLVEAARIAPTECARAYEAVRAMGANLALAVETCLDAASHEWDTDTQRPLLQAALFGQTWLDAPDPARMVQVSRTLRVLHAVRAPSVGVPASYDENAVGVWLYRLAARAQHGRAVAICEALHLKADAVLLHWARVYMARIRATDDDESVAQTIIARFQRARTLRYADIAMTAWQAGRPRVATRLLEHELRAVDQVPLLLQMHEHRPALARAVESGDTDLVYHVLFTLQRHLSRAAFLDVVQTADVRDTEWDTHTVGLRPSARPAYVALAAHLLETYAREQDEGLLRDYYFQDDRHSDLALQCVAQAYAVPASERGEALRRAQQHFGDDRACATEARLTGEACALLAVQTTLAAELAALGVRPTPGVVGRSLYDTIALCVAHGLPRRAERLQHEFRVPDARYFAIQMRALIAQGDLAALWRVATQRRPPGGYEPVVSALLHAGHVEEACRYVAKGASDKASRTRILYVQHTYPAHCSTGARMRRCASGCRRLCPRYPGGAPRSPRAAGPAPLFRHARWHPAWTADRS